MGTGSIGTRHLKILRGLGSVTPVAVPKRRERLAQLAEEGYDTAASLDEAMDKGITLGIVASETGLHVADGSACIQRGLDILVEKPLAVNAEQAGVLSGHGQAANPTRVGSTAVPVLRARNPIHHLSLEKARP